MKRSKRLKKCLAIILSISLAIGSMPFAFAETTSPVPPAEPPLEDDRLIIDGIEIDMSGFYEDEEEVNPEDLMENEVKVEEEEEEKVVLSDADAVKADKEELDIGFTLCVSRDLPFITEGENGSKITWKSSRPDIISNEGKFTAPVKITDLYVTATISKGNYKEEKRFNITANNRSMYEVVMDYVNTMIDYGRDDHYFTPEEYANSNRVEAMTDLIGKNAASRKSGLFFSMLDRDTLKYPTFYVNEWPRMQYNSDERGSGCTTSYEMWLYEILYDLTAMTGDKKYEEIADQNFSFFLENMIHPDSGVAAWGIHALYDPVTGSSNAPNQYATSEVEQSAWSGYNEPGWGDKYFMTVPFFVNKFFELNPNAMHKHLLSWYSATLANKKDFTFSRHTKINGAANSSGNYASMLNPMAYAYAWGYHYTGNPQFKEALNTMMNWIERLSSWNEYYLFPQELYVTANRFRQSWMGDNMGVACFFQDLLPIVPDDIKERMERYIDKVITDFMHYAPEKGASSFATYYTLRTGKVSSYRTPYENPNYYKKWRQLPDGELKDKFGSWLIDWTDKYAFDPLIDKLKISEFFPRTIADEMELMRVVYEETRDEKYLNRLLEIADFAIYDFWEMESLLPSMTHAQKKYYEATWGSVQVVKGIWDAHFLDVERKTGTHPVKDAWEKAGYMTKDMREIAGDEEWYAATKFVNEIGDGAE